MLQFRRFEILIWLVMLLFSWQTLSLYQIPEILTLDKFDFSLTQTAYAYSGVGKDGSIQDITANTYNSLMVTTNTNSNVTPYGTANINPATTNTQANQPPTTEMTTYTYDAFGNLIAKTGNTPNNYLFSGEQYDPNIGYYYLRARYMDPKTGRFITTDPYPGISRTPT